MYLHIHIVDKLVRLDFRNYSTSSSTSRFVKAEYMRQLDIIAPHYLSETYKALIEQDGVICNVYLKVSHLGVYYTVESKKDVWRNCQITYLT